MANINKTYADLQRAAARNAERLENLVSSLDDDAKLALLVQKAQEETDARNASIAAYKTRGQMITEALAKIQVDAAAASKTTKRTKMKKEEKT